MARHPDWEKLEGLMPAVREFQALATEHGIDDVFQDNGGKILQMLLALNLQGIPGREGNDAVDVEGREYELKSVNIHLTAGFSTNHHINVPIIEKYRQAHWAFAIYEGIEMRRAFSVPTEKLEEHFSKWEKQWNETEKDINNPKVPLKFVIDNGECLFDDGNPLDLDAAKKIRSKRTKESADRRKAKAEAVADLKKDATAGDNPIAILRGRGKKAK